MYSEKYEKGLELFKSIHGGLTAEQTIENLESIAPDMVKYTMEWIFADLYSDNTIDMKTREISNISSLVAIGALPQLKNHIHAALKLGFSADEVRKIIMNNLIIVGFPKVVNALMVLKESVELNQEKPRE
jgi:4-carboxymuconolactone decarboxylase